MKRWLFLLVLMAANLQAQETPEVKPPSGNGSMIFLRDYGTDDIGYIVVPEKEPSAGVVVLPDRRGMTPEFKKFCEKLAEEGYIVLGLDLYNGRIAKDDNEAAQMAASLQEKNFAKTLQTGIKMFESSPRFQMDKKMLVACGVSGELAVKSIAKEKRLIYSLALVNPAVLPDKESILSLRMPFSVLVPSSSPALPGIRDASADLSARMKKNFELHLVEKDNYIPALNTFFHRVLTEPPTQTLIEKIF